MPDEFEDSDTTGSLKDEIRPIAQRLFELTVKQGALEAEIEDLRSQLKKYNLAQTGNLKFEFSDTGTVSMRKQGPTFTKDTTTGKFSNLNPDMRGKLIAAGMLSRKENLVVNENLAMLENSEIQKYIDAGVIKNEVSYRAQKISVSEDNGEFIRDMIKQGIMEEGKSYIRVATQTPGRKSKRGRPKKSE